MAFFTITADSKGRLAIVAGSAGLTLLHLRHGKAGRTATSGIHSTMAIITLEKFEMGAMAEAGVKSLKGDVFYILVAFLTIVFDGKSGFAIMAGAARLPFFHIQHRMSDPVGAGYKQFVVTIRTVKRHLQMSFVTEDRFAAHGNIPNLVAFDAVTFDGKSGFTFVTGAARFTLFHLTHGNMGICPTGLEQTVMTVVAAVHIQMFFVAEH